MSDRRRVGEATRRICKTAPLVVGMLVASTEAGYAQTTWQERGGAATDAEAISLQEAVETALDRSRRLRAAYANLDEASERVSEAWGSVYPSVDFSMNYTRNISPAVNFLPAFIFDPDAAPDEQVAVEFGAENAWNGQIDVQQALFKPAVFIGVSAAGRFAALQEEVVRGETETVVTDVRLSYYALLLAQEQRRLTENSVERVRQTLEETRALNQAGLSSDYDVLRLEVELANLEPNLRRSENAIRQAQRNLAVMLDLPDLRGIAVEGNLATIDLDELGNNSAENLGLVSFVGFDLDDAPSETAAGAVGARADVRQAELTTDLRHAEMRVEQVSYLPEISLFGAYQVASSQNGDPSFFGRPRAYSRRVGVSVSLPVFNGFARESRIDQKQALLRAAEAQSSLARDMAESEILTAIDQAQEARLRAGSQSLAVTQAQRGYEIASSQYLEGIGSQLEVTDAEVALRQSEFNYAQSVYDYLVARAQLDRATGQVPLVGAGARQ